MSITVLTTGGTIDKVYFDANSTFQVGDSVVSELLRQAHVELPVEINGLMKKDSLELTDADRAAILAAVQQTPGQQIVITHGTDTMTQTAAVLAAARDKVIVLTGAFSPARFAMSDAIFNIGMAFAAVQTLAPGVYIAVSGQVFEAHRVVKNLAAQRFELRSMDESTDESTDGSTDE